MKNKMAGLLMESGAVYVKAKLHGKKYFASLLEELEEVPESVKDLLRMSRGAMEMFESTQQQAGPRVARRSRTGAAGGAIDDDSSRRRDHGSDLGAGGRRPASLSLLLAMR